MNHQDTAARIRASLSPELAEIFDQLLRDATDEIDRLTKDRAQTDRLYAETLTERESAKESAREGAEIILRLQGELEIAKEAYQALALATGHPIPVDADKAPAEPNNPDEFWRRQDEAEARFLAEQARDRRDRFACAALTGFLAKGLDDKAVIRDAEIVALEAFEIADAMIAHADNPLPPITEAEALAELEAVSKLPGMEDQFGMVRES